MLQGGDEAGRKPDLAGPEPRVPEDDVAVVGGARRGTARQQGDDAEGDAVGRGGHQGSPSITAWAPGTGLSFWVGKAAPRKAFMSSSIAMTRRRLLV